MESQTESMRRRTGVGAASIILPNYVESSAGGPLRRSKCCFDVGVGMCRRQIPAAIGKNENALIEHRQREVAVKRVVRPEQIPVIVSRTRHECKVKKGALSIGGHGLSAAAQHLGEPLTQTLTAAAQVLVQAVPAPAQLVQRDLCRGKRERTPVQSTSVNHLSGRDQFHVLRV